MVLAPLVHFYLRQAAPPEDENRPVCGLREAVVSTFTSQYVAGVAYIVVAFIRREETTYYHLRIIHGLCGINLVVGVVSEYNRRSMGTVLLYASRTKVRG
jgi:hypothetical protein